MSSDLLAGPAPTLQPDQENLQAKLSWIGMRHLAANLDDFVAHATQNRWAPLEIIEQLARLESTEKARRSLQNRLRNARLGRFKMIADFDYSWPKEINQDLLHEILTLDFVREPRNVILMGTQGLGKTMIAKNIAYQAIHTGYTALFTPASKIIADIAGQESTVAQERRFRHYAKPSLLVIDELGYLSYDNAAADILFQLVNRRYENKPIILTTNLAFRDWSTIFPNAAAASALVDRLTHLSLVLLIKGDSYRKHEAQKDRERRSRADQ